MARDTRGIWIEILKKWVILQEFPNTCPQTLMSHYGFQFWNIKKIFVFYVQNVDQSVCANLQIKNLLFH